MEILRVSDSRGYTNKLVHNLSRTLTKNSIRHITGLLMGHRQCYVLSAMEKEALEELQSDSTIVILPANKGRATVIMDKPKYTCKIPLVCP